HTMLSDICFIIAENADYGQVIFQAGFDLIREEKIPGTSLEQSKLPSLTSALHRGKILTITENDVQPPDLLTINAALGLKESGSLLFIPIFTSGNPHGGILFLSPYSNRQWNSDDQGFLASDLELITEILNKAQQPPESSVRETTDRLPDPLRAELENLRQDNKVLLMELSEYRQNESKSPQPVPSLDLKALVALQQEAQEQISNLQTENDRLVGLLSNGGQNFAPSDEVSRIEQELRSSLGDLALLQNELANANARILDLERNSKSGGAASEDIEVITSTAQEIRQPLTSIGGYTELLLSESVGILGALQRKFLERIQASIERLSTILDDLVRVTIMSERPIELLPEPIEFGTIVDGAIADSSAQLREKDIALRVDLPEEMPRIVADRDAIQQIILHLLQNAGAATPQESTITLRSRIQKQYEEDFLLIQVTDNGGGIRAEDLPRVFARNYRADKALIQGLGDTGVGLSIAKTLVEAHGGRIWVDSIFGQSTTISILLPLHPNLASTMK
ncbi:MAG: HAMP domain-containing histidine kinase, partial [Anaerolineaceae bacterium]|nr:HAMP domain-containing histidine kinase [Anaerolineaceae bacterium]